jgi:transposase
MPMTASSGRWQPPESQRFPAQASRTTPRDFDPELYKARHLIEKFLFHTRQFRAIATRYDKTARSFLAGIHLAAATARSTRRPR